MSGIKCPFCQQELKYDSWNEVYMCRNPNCKHLLGFGTKELWQELIRTKELLEVESSEHELCHDAMVKRTEEVNRTRKALGIAVDALVLYANSSLGDMANEALKQITALEQKEGQ